MRANATYLLRKASRRAGGRLKRRASLSTVWIFELLQDFKPAVFHRQDHNAFIGSRIAAFGKSERSHDAVEVGLVERLADLVALRAAGTVDRLGHDIHRVIGLRRELVGVIAVALLEAG